MGIPKNDGQRTPHNPFTYMVEELDEDGGVKRQLGGCDNVIGAQAMFRALPPEFNENDRLRLRQGARVMSEVRGTGEARRAALARLHWKSQ